MSRMSFEPISAWKRRILSCVSFGSLYRTTSKIRDCFIAFGFCPARVRTSWKAPSLALCEAFMITLFLKPWSITLKVLGMACGRYVLKFSQIDADILFLFDMTRPTMAGRLETHERADYSPLGNINSSLWNSQKTFSGTTALQSLTKSTSFSNSMWPSQPGSLDRDARKSLTLIWLARHLALGNV